MFTVLGVYLTRVWLWFSAAVALSRAKRMAKIVEAAIEAAKKARAEATSAEEAASGWFYSARRTAEIAIERAKKANSTQDAAENYLRLSQERKEGHHVLEDEVRSLREQQKKYERSVRQYEDEVYILCKRIQELEGGPLDDSSILQRRFQTTFMRWREAPGWTDHPPTTGVT